MDYTVELALHTRRRLTEDDLAAVAEIGGAASGNQGDTRLETTLTIKAADLPAAAALAIARITDLVAGTVIAVNAMTTEEADRRLDAAAPEYVGITEIAAYLGVTKQRALQLSQRDDFPAPIATLASGKVWRKGDLSTFASGWQRKAGRPRRAPAIAEARGVSPAG